MKYLFAASFLISALWMGCCPTCESDYLGEFALADETARLMSFADGQPRIFTNTLGTQMTMSYTDALLETTDGLQNCFETQCELCCDTYIEARTAATLTSIDAAYQFTLIATKDFIRYTPESGTDEVLDRLTISLNGGLMGDVVDLPVTQPAQQVVLNNRTFAGVFAFEFNDTRPEYQDVIAYYFQPEVGIVGFIQADSMVWNLTL